MLSESGRDSEDVWSRFVLEFVMWPKEVTFVSRTQPSGPLCLWQCFFYCFVSASIHFGGQKSKLRGVKGDSRKQKKTACILYVLWKYCCLAKNTLYSLCTLKILWFSKKTACILHVLWKYSPWRRVQSSLQNQEACRIQAPWNKKVLLLLLLL